MTLTDASVFVARMDSDVTQLIERLEAFEERVGVRLEALYAHFDSDGYLNLTVNGEVHPREGTTIKQDIVVHVGACDTSGRLVAKSETWLMADEFFGFATFQVEEHLPIHELSKIRVCPKV
ncbi:MAG: hypothetical protein KGS61_12795 [Verrucomicrobia bacterium]|nr:hypothetical protein [Verrucomicrobiota bacterium]